MQQLLHIHPGIPIQSVTTALLRTSDKRMGIPGFSVYQPANILIDILIIHFFEQRIYLMVNMSGDFTYLQTFVTCFKQDIEYLPFVVHAKQNKGSWKRKTPNSPQ